MVEDHEVGHRGGPLDTNFAANMTRLREAAGISQAEMVHKLRDEGWASVHPTTISRIEKGERVARLSEAVQIANVLGTDLSRMLARPDRAGIEEEVDNAIEPLTKNYNQIVESVYWLATLRTVLRSRLAEFRTVADREGDDRLRQKLASAERYLGLRVDNAVKVGREAYKGSAVGRHDFADRYLVNPDHAPDFVSEEDINAAEA